MLLTDTEKFFIEYVRKNHNYLQLFCGKIPYVTLNDYEYNFLLELNYLLNGDL